MKKILVLFVAGVLILFVISRAASYVPSVGNGGEVQVKENNDSVGTYSNQTNPLLNIDGFSGTSNSGSSVSSGNTSPYASSIRLSSGNAAGSIQPFEEYVSIENVGKSSISITGWKFENGKGSRPIQTSQNTYVYPSPESATIGYGTEFLSPNGVYATGNIVLKPRDRAIVTTGGPFSGYSLPITTSFRENICLGYLDTYPFTPRVSYSCPAITSDPLVTTMTDECETYLRRINRCEDPTVKDYDGFDELGSQCKQFIKDRLNYPSCVAIHKNDSNFSTNQWRVFLGRTRELWAQDNETITLYDAQGLVVAQISY